MAKHFTKAQKIAELKREIKIRERVYPHWIVQGKVEANEAYDRIDILKAILADYERDPQQKLF